MNTSRTRMILITVALGCLGVNAVWAQSKPMPDKQKAEAAAKADADAKKQAAEAKAKEEIAAKQKAEAAAKAATTAGGSPFTSDCGSDGVMVGIRARTGSLVDSVQAICTKVSSNGAWVGGQFDGARAGGNGGSPVDLRCADGSAVTAVYGKSGTLVDSIGVRCGRMEAAGATTMKIVGGSATVSAVGGSGGSAFDRPCSSEQIAKGISGRAGTLIDQLSSVACHNPTPQTASGTAAIAFQPKSVTTGELTMTGLRFQPKSVTTGELTMTGLRFQPRSVTTGELTMTGLRFPPKSVTTGELTMTGLRFQPKSVTTGELTMTGLREPPR